MRRKVMSKNMAERGTFMTACGMCAIGIGETKYDSGKFEHIEQKKHSMYGKEVCGSCYKKYNGKKKEFEKALNKSERELANSFDV